MNYIICGILCNLLISEHFFMVTTHNKTIFALPRPDSQVVWKVILKSTWDKDPAHNRCAVMLRLPLNLDTEIEQTSVKQRLSDLGTIVGHCNILCWEAPGELCHWPFALYCVTAMDDSKSKGKKLPYFGGREKGLKLKFRKIYSY